MRVNRDTWYNSSQIAFWKHLFKYIPVRSTLYSPPTHTHPKWQHNNTDLALNWQASLYSSAISNMYSLYLEPKRQRFGFRFRSKSVFFAVDLNVWGYKVNLPGIYIFMFRLYDRRLDRFSKMECFTCTLASSKHFAFALKKFSIIMENLNTVLPYEHI